MKYSLLISAAFIIGLYPPPSPWFFVGVLMAILYGVLKLLDEHLAKLEKQEREKRDLEN